MEKSKEQTVKQITYKQVTVYTDETPVIASNSSFMNSKEETGKEGKSAEFMTVPECEQLFRRTNNLDEITNPSYIQIRALEIYADQFKQRIAELESDLKRKDEVLGFGEAWPLPDVLMKLVESTEYLLHVKNYDRTGWEEVSHCTKLGRQYINKINAVIAEQAQKASEPIETKPKFKCYEIHTVQARMYGCDKQCDECKKEQALNIKS